MFGINLYALKNGFAISQGLVRWIFKREKCSHYFNIGDDREGQGAVLILIITFGEGYY